MRRLLLVVYLAIATAASASDALQWSGFALLRASNATTAVPLDDDTFAAQLQIGVDWRPSMTLGAHVHLIARNDADHGKRARVGVTEAYLEQNLHRGDGRLHIMEGAFFLPTTRENVDALWESPYTITPSALNSWLGEEFRPIGVDAAYTLRHSLTGGITVFTGNDTFGALAAGRGWMMRDHWALLGEHLPVDGTYLVRFRRDRSPPRLVDPRALEHRPLHRAAHAHRQSLRRRGARRAVQLGDALRHRRRRLHH